MLSKGGFMKKQIGITVLAGLFLGNVYGEDLKPLPVGAARETSPKMDRIYGSVLKKFVQDGRVDYRGLKADPFSLTQYLLLSGQVSESEFKSWNEKRQLAFLINLYNASTLKGPWDQPIVPLFGKTITLNELEHGIIRKQYREPRVHMALVCAAKGCPPLRGEAYTAEKLDDQLVDQSRAFLASPAGLAIDREKGIVSISSIFKWYGSDFPSVPGFIEKHSHQDLNGLKIRYLDYDWSLNE
jgi:hypothetical protein